MPDKKISQLTSLAQGDIATTTDVLAIVDTSATETKKATPAAIVGAAAAAGLTSVDINSGAIDGTTIGANSAAAGTFTNLTASGTVSFSGATVSNGGSVTTVDINGGTIDGASVGASSASSGAFTTLSASGSVTLSGGTANGVLYLNGSKVATSGSALTFNGSKLEVSSSGEQVKLTSSGDFSSSGTGYIRWYDSVGAKGYVGYAGTASRFDLQTGTGMNFFLNAVGGNAIFAVSNTEQMRLTSTGLGIGTSSPTYKLHLVGKQIIEKSGAGYEAAMLSFATISETGAIYRMGMASGGAFIIGRSDTATTNLTLDVSGNLGIGTSSPTAGFRLDVVGGDFRVSDAASDDGVEIGWSAGGNAAFVQAYDRNASAFRTLILNNAATLDTSGNLGLGVTPSAWSGGKWMQFVSTTAVGQQGNGTANLMCNAYESSGNNFSYIASVGAARYNVQAGTHAWFTAPSGTAGNAITFTQAMTLDASGRLGIGTTSPAQPLHVDSSGGGVVRVTRLSANASAFGQLENDGTNSTISSTGALILNTGSSPAERARITAGGEVYIAGTTDQGAYNLQVNGTGVWGAGAYVNGSDARLKDNIQSLDSGLDVVKAIRPVTFQYKPEYSKDQSVQPGFIAQELQEAMAGKPYLEGVVQAGPNHLNVAYQNIIPILVKAIQELEAKVAALEAK